jgi:two-component system sensor histidine kinase YesM
MNKNANSRILIYDEDGDPLSLQPGSDFYEIAANPKVKTYITNNNGLNSSNLTLNNESYTITKIDLGVNNFMLVNFISNTELLKHLDSLKIFTFLILLFFISFSILLSLKLSSSITSPIRNLMFLVDDIGKGNYRQYTSYTYKDEVGKLINSLNKMSAIINDQINIIKQQEKDKTNAEIDILTRQINPHFLYNTLDCIHWEILCGNIEGSSNMVESLGHFLRIGISGNTRTLSIEKEIHRLTEYIAIMNFRKSINIKLNTMVVNENLLKEKILVLILQPLIENCIKHGFDETTQLIIADPQINLRFYEEDAYIIIEVEDNGKGMDINKMTSIINADSSEEISHVGIRNVYFRLKTYYGDDVSMTFNTTPFYKNTITLKFNKNSINENI